MTRCSAIYRLLLKDTMRECRLVLPPLVFLKVLLVQEAVECCAALHHHCHSLCLLKG